MRLEQIPLEPLDGVPDVAMGLLTPGTAPERVRVDVAVLQPGASLPRHPAGREQVFYVVDGRGRVAGDDGVGVAITAGWAAVWNAGEQHTSWAETQMTVVVAQRGPADV